jgi:hypothetical protein
MPAAPKLPTLARQALEDPDVLQRLLDSLSPENTDLKARERAFKALLPLAQAKPDALLPHWNALAALLKSDKAFSKYPAIHLIAAIVPSDQQRRFDRSFSAYFALLDDEAVSVAAHAARLAGAIAQARPDLEPRITRQLLALDRSHFGADRRDLVKSYALEAFTATFDRSKQQPAIVAFAQSMLKSKSPRAVKAAKAFLKTHSLEERASTNRPGNQRVSVRR